MFDIEETLSGRYMRRNCRTVEGNELVEVAVVAVVVEDDGSFRREMTKESW